MATAGDFTARLNKASTTDPSYPSLAALQVNVVEQAANGFATHYAGGEFEPTAYFTPNWEKYQAVAVADATLGAMPASDLTAQQQSQQLSDRHTATATLNKAIGTHQLANGDFDGGIPSLGGSGVAGTFWGEAEGEAAIELAPYVSAAQKQGWTTSMENYSNYLWTTQLDPSTNAEWYTNGNAVLREAVILMETYMLSGNAKYLSEYTVAREFLATPGVLQTRWSAAGWIPGQGGAGWYSESPASSPNQPLVCASGMNPCNGFDPNYTMAQLNDAMLAYELSGDSQWLTSVQGLYAALVPLVTASSSYIDASNGSRYNIPSEVFYVPIYELLASNNLASADDPAWIQQQATLSHQLVMAAAQADPGPNAFYLAESATLGLLDSAQTK